MPENHPEVIESDRMFEAVQELCLAVERLIRCLPAQPQDEPQEN